MSSAESDTRLNQGPSPEAFASVRREFPSLPRLAYLNSGSYGLLGNQVRAAFDEYLDLRMQVGADWDMWVERSLRVGAKVATLLNAQTEEIAVTASASAGMNAIASALDFSGERNRIVVSNYEFPTSGQIWHAQQPRGADIVHVPEDSEGRLPVEHFARVVDERTRIVVLSQVCFRHGGRIADDEIREITRIAHRHGAYVILDVFQAVGARPIDAKALGVDFVVGGMFKYLLGTAGIGFLYVRSELIDHLVPTASGWFAQQQMGSMDIFANDPSRTAARFQAGTPPVPSCYAADAGLGIILELGAQAISTHIGGLTDTAWQRFISEGFHLATPAGCHGPMLALRAKDAPVLVQRLIEQGVVTSYRDGNLRVGFHFYNNEDDLDRLMAGLVAYRDLLA